MVEATLGGPPTPSSRKRFRLQRKLTLRSSLRTAEAADPSTQPRKDLPLPPTAGSGEWPTSSLGKARSRLEKPSMITLEKYQRRKHHGCRRSPALQATYPSLRLPASPRSCVSQRILTRLWKATPFPIWYPEAYAGPVKVIFDRVKASGVWPKAWKTEFLTIIPKVPKPASLRECRNISCMSVFSKILEGQVLLKLRSELLPDQNQYGGKPKCGVEHMLVDLWEKVLCSLEGGANAAVLLGIDYEKAFNRMEHAVCLRQLEKFKVRVWMTYHLRRSGFKRRQLNRLYCCYLRTVIE